MVLFHIVVPEPETNGGISQRYTGELIEYVTELGGGALQKMPAGRHIEKQVFHHDVGAGITCAGFLQLYLGAFYNDAGASLTGSLPGFQLYLGDGGNGGQRLATEAHGAYGEQVFYTTDLRCGM